MASGEGNAELIALFSAHQVLRGFSGRTIERRAGTLKLLGSATRDAPLEQVNATDLERFLGGYACAQTRQSYRSDANQFYRYLVKRGVVVANPCDLVDTARVPRRAPTPIPTIDVVRSIAAARGWERPMVMLIAFAGLRCSEVAHLRGEHIDLVTRVLVVRNGKGGKDETVPIADELAIELACWPSRGPLFPGANRGHVYRRIKAVFIRLNIEARPHDLRASYGTTAAIRCNGNIPLVQRLMRHDSMKSTERYIGWNPPGGDVVDGLYGPLSAA